MILEDIILFRLSQKFLEGLILFRLSQNILTASLFSGFFKKGKKIGAGIG